MQPQLSIITLTLPDRFKAFNRIKAAIDRQIYYSHKVHPSLGIVQHVVVDDQIKKSIGLRRNMGLSRAKGKYIAFVDDDDMISPQYVESILRATHEGKEAIAFNYLLFNENMVTDLDSSLGSDHTPILSSDSYQNETGIWHTSAIRNDIAKQGEFTDGNWNEDINYLEQVRPLVKDVLHINKFLYFYLKGWKIEQR